LLTRIGLNESNSNQISGVETSDFCRPRPEWRNRAYFIGTRSGCLKEIVDNVKQLLKVHDENPKRHHIETCLQSVSSQEGGPETVQSESDKVKAASEYFACFKTAFEKAKTAKRLGDLPLLDWKCRASSVANLPVNTSPWMKAQIDIYEAILAHSLQGQDVAEAFGNDFHPIADVGQSADRGALAVQGTIPSLTTSSRLFSYKLKRHGTQCIQAANI
jgi:hypothetical protein